MKSWITVREFLRILLEIAYEHAPDMKTAIKAIGLTFKRAKTLEKQCGVRFSKPVRKFWDMRPMPHYLECFIEAHKNRHKRDYTSNPPPPPKPPPPRRPEPGTIRW
jgi:hypothetical protein